MTLLLGPYFSIYFYLLPYFSSGRALDATLSNYSNLPSLDELNSKRGLMFFLALAPWFAFKLDLLILLLFITAEDDILSLFTVFSKYLFPSSRCLILLFKLASSPA